MKANIITFYRILIGFRFALVTPVIISTLFIGGCLSGFLGREELANYLDHHTDSTKIIQTEVRYLITAEDDVKLFEHIIIKAGIDPYELIQHLQAVNNSSKKLNDYKLKILLPNGRVKSFKKGDLYRRALSSSDIISQAEVLLPTINIDQLGGSVIELQLEYQIEIPEFGLVFSPVYYGKDIGQLIFTIEYPADMAVAYRLVNDIQKPQINSRDKSSYIRFRWDDFSYDFNDLQLMEQRNNYPVVFASAHFDFPDKSTTPKDSLTWIRWGDWYISLIEKKMITDNSLAPLVRSILTENSSELEKMKQIFYYVNQQIRYEQNYQEFGEIVPNAARDILANKYGDCKDYSLIMYLLARQAGIKTELALCHRGRGDAFYPDITASQFNHMILHYDHNGQDYWLDGTNRIGSFGKTTTDLNNQLALIISPQSSHLKKILPDDESLLQIAADLQTEGVSLRGEIICKFKAQYAINLNYLEWYENENQVLESLEYLIKNLVNKDMTIDDLSWSSTPDLFEITLQAYFPNALVMHNEYTYLSPSRVFSELSDEFENAGDVSSLYYNPGYEKVELNISLPYLKEVKKEDGSAFSWDMEYILPFGPYQDDKTQAQIINQLDSLSAQLCKQFKLEESL